MKDTDNKRYFRFLHRLWWFAIPLLGVAVLLHVAWENAPELPRLLGMAALAACVLASVTTYRK